ncbi:MAG: 3-oxoadipate enol-lactonase [Candidatus Limnocylindrales bacterium]
MSTRRSSVQVHHEVEGPPDAPALVLSDSLGSTLSMWDPQMSRLRERFRVIRYDHRGHGRSPVPSGPYEISDLGCDVLELLDRLDVGRAHLCGLSIGGMVAMWLAANAPDRVDRLVLCCTSARFGTPEAWAERAAIVRAQGTEAVADMVVARWFTPAFAAERPGVVAEMREMIASTPAEGYAACCGVVERTDLGPCLPSIVAATLVIAGAQDQAAPVEHGQRITDAITGSRLSVVDRAAHLANIERAETVNDLILAHLLDAPIKEEP